MLKSALILETLIIVLQVQRITSVATFPSGLHANESTTCEEFSRFARFSPYSVLGDEWMVFYYWGPPQSPMFVNFSVPTTAQKDYLKFIMDGHVLEPINWTAKILVMTERHNTTFVLVERNDRGHYYIYLPYKDLEDGEIIPTTDVRIKQTGDGKYFAIMFCKEDIVFVFARLKEVPKKNVLQDEAAKIGYKGRGGKSYLYQGHQWMPIPEAEDYEFDHAIQNRHHYMRTN